MGEKNDNNTRIFNHAKEEAENEVGKMREYLSNASPSFGGDAKEVQKLEEAQAFANAFELDNKFADLRSSPNKARGGAKQNRNQTIEMVRMDGENTNTKDYKPKNKTNARAKKKPKISQEHEAKMKGLIKDLKDLETQKEKLAKSIKELREEEKHLSEELKKQESGGQKLTKVQKDKLVNLREKIRVLRRGDMDNLDKNIRIKKNVINALKTRIQSPQTKPEITLEELKGTLENLQKKKLRVVNLTKPNKNESGVEMLQKLSNLKKNWRTIAQLDADIEDTQKKINSARSQLIDNNDNEEPNDNQSVAPKKDESKLTENKSPNIEATVEQNDEDGEQNRNTNKGVKEPLCTTITVNIIDGRQNAYDNAFRKAANDYTGGGTFKCFDKDSDSNELNNCKSLTAEQKKDIRAGKLKVYVFPSREEALDFMKCQENAGVISEVPEELQNLQNLQNPQKHQANTKRGKPGWFKKKSPPGGKNKRACWRETHTSRSESHFSELPDGSTRRSESLYTSHSINGKCISENSRSETSTTSPTSMKN